ncbi:hypothetical protein M0805_009796 [Coniferiporia weirii]|nr:hypothetical protein M0805_009796 [Coniferiporia weirii]
MQPNGTRTSFSGLDATSIPGHGDKGAKLRLRFVIIGAGVAGLACAYTLIQAGHDVHVLEAEKGLCKSPGSMRVPPNMSRILVRWGLGAELEKCSGGRCSKLVFQSAFTGETYGEILFHKEVMKAFEADMHLIHHTDLMEMLYKLAVDAGARVSFGSRVASVNPAAASVTLHTGQEIFGDIIVGADGDEGIVRPLLLEDGVEEVTDGTYTSYLFTVPRTLMGDDQGLLGLLETPMWRLWTADDWTTIAHTVAEKRGGSDFVVSLYKKEKASSASRDWRHSVPLIDVIPEMAELEPRLARLMELAVTAVRTKHVLPEPLDSWYDEEGHILVVGDAAHVLNPCSTYTAALAIEDAVVLGELFSRLTSRDHIRRFLGAFQDLRQPRREFVQAADLDQAAFITMPPGPERDARDASMRLELEKGQQDWTEAPEEVGLLKQWEEFKEVWGYDAFEDADTWWVEWGTLLERMDALNGGENEYVPEEFLQVRSDVFGPVH